MREQIKNFSILLIFCLEIAKVRLSEFCVMGAEYIKGYVKFFDKNRERKKSLKSEGKKAFWKPSAFNI